MTRSVQAPNSGAPAWRTPAIIGGVVALAVIAGILLALVLSGNGGVAGGDPSLTPTPSAPASPSAEPSEQPSEAPSEELAPSEAPTPAPTSSNGSAVRLEQTASFDVSPGTSYVTDVVAWSEGFLAIGSAWESEFHVTDEMPAMWLSRDGRSWEEHPVELGVGSVTLVGVAERADGRLLLVGTVPGSGAVPEGGTPQSVAWVSEDALRWEAVDLPLAEDVLVDALAHGPKGYVLSASADATGGELWFSTDGSEWTKTHEGAAGVVAGDEGFVAVQSGSEAGGTSVVASADGRTWLASEPIGAALGDLVALGGDWLATAHESDSMTIQVLHSPNGLDWTPVLDVNDLTGPDGPKTGRGLNEEAINHAFLAGEGGSGFLMLGDSHCCAQPPWTYGVWMTTDGRSWTEVISGSAHVSSAAVGDGMMVLGGHLGRGEDPAFWVAP